ncbi:lambda exonuclease family protein [Arthrobacter woluwensis]|uniref:YqaJ-like recombinase domain-containing protein n=1 Tax=Arthrobacter woluwensis TaxID=156980 RepID=A0A1H4WC24_9MICC|nr:lambda exonuclease family protein [Arthrobacter woluwensis]SEC90171.1 YqaJ-like recombinase domain-containing protein [Arthrobacter woluwensis]SEC95483.1 YqaJ-like recombinase domain-containing protein [Arthrobacter woluwensis]
MTLTIYNNLEQGADEWLQARCGILTASVIGQLITPSLGIADNETSRRLIRKLAAERITGHPITTYPTKAMQRGTLLEPWARDAYAEHAGVTVDEVGFMRIDTEGGSLGYSPDGLVGDDGLIEIKCPGPDTHFQTVVDNKVPDEHWGQLQAGLLVSGRTWIDFVSFCPGANTFVRRVEPSPAWRATLITAFVAAEERITDALNYYQANVKRYSLPAAKWFDPFEEDQITLERSI